MKIIEIINEDINEGVRSDLARWLASKLGARATAKRPARIDDFAERYINRHDVHASDTSLRHAFPGENLDDVRREIEARARSRFGRQHRRDRRDQRMTRDINFINNVFGRYLTFIRNAINLVALGEVGYILYEPFEQYYTRMSTAGEWLNANDPNERWSQEKYDAFHRQELISLVNKMARIYVANRILRLVPNIGRLLGDRVGNAVSTLSRPIRYLLADEIAKTPQIAEAFSITMINHLFPKENGKVPPVVENIIGSKLADAENAIFGAIKQVEGLPGQGTTNNSTSTQPDTASSTQATQATQAAQTDTASNVQTGVTKTPSVKPLTREQIKLIKPEELKQVGADYYLHIPTGNYIRKHQLPNF